MPGGTPETLQIVGSRFSQQSMKQVFPPLPLSIPLVSHWEETEKGEGEVRLKLLRYRVLPRAWSRRDAHIGSAFLDPYVQ